MYLIVGLSASPVLTIAGHQDVKTCYTYPCPPLSLSSSLSAHQPCTTFSHAPLNLHIFDPPPSKIHQFSTTWLLLTLSSRVAFRRLLTP